MKTLADMIVASAHRDKNLPTHIVEALRLPAQNHAPVDHGQYLPLVERFVFIEPLRFSDAWAVSAFDSMTERATFMHPLDTYWLEATWAAPRMTLSFGVMFKDQRLWIFVKNAGMPILLGACPTPSEMPNGQFRIEVKPARGLPVGTDKDAADFMALIVEKLWLLLASLASSHTVSTRRQIITQPDFATRRMLNRRFQTGQPFLSANIVEFRKPETCIYRGEVRETASFAGKRGHLVIGHWRLIDKTMTPFWVWVDGHPRGDLNLGWVQKTRVVKDAERPKRKGAPEFAGTRGMRIPTVSHQ